MGAGAGAGAISGTKEPDIRDIRGRAVTYQYDTFPSDEHFQYRIVTVTHTKPLTSYPSMREMKFSAGTLLTEQEWRRRGIQQSLGWVHVLWSPFDTAQPVLLFKRPLGISRDTGLMDWKARLVAVRERAMELLQISASAAEERYREPPAVDPDFLKLAMKLNKTTFGLVIPPCPSAEAESLLEKIEAK